MYVYIYVCMYGCYTFICMTVCKYCEDTMVQSNSLFYSIFSFLFRVKPLLNSYYGKPDRVIHYSYILCNGNEQLITSCNKVIHSLEEGRQIYNDAEVAGVACNQASPTPEPTEEVYMST